MGFLNFKSFSTALFGLQAARFRPLMGFLNFKSDEEYNKANAEIVSVPLWGFLISNEEFKKAIKEWFTFPSPYGVS